MFLIMKQKTRSENFQNIGYRSMNGQMYRPQKSHIGRSLINTILEILEADRQSIYCWPVA